MSEDGLDYSRLGWNIKCLRKANGETSEEMMAKLGVESTGTVPQYESGKRIPLRDNLLKIAKHFHVTVDELLYGDFTGLDFVNCSLDNRCAMNSLIDVSFPTVVSARAMENQAFSCAYRLHTILIQYMKHGIQYDGHKIEVCLDFYAQAYNEGIAEATANLLWWMLFEAVCICNTSLHFSDSITKLQRSQITKREFWKRQHLHSFEPSCYDLKTSADRKKQVEAYISEVEPGIIRLLKELKMEPQYADLADYYSALRYTFGVVSNDLSSELNALVGRQMMISLGELGNKYAKELADAGMDLFN